MLPIGFIGLLPGNYAISAKRRVIAAGLAGYLAINVAALFTAIEFGIQPLYFVDVAGAPLYAPYPLEIAIPAMMIGHVTIAGLAELFLTAGLLAYLQLLPRVAATKSAKKTENNV